MMHKMILNLIYINTGTKILTLSFNIIFYNKIAFHKKIVFKDTQIIKF